MKARLSLTISIAATMLWSCQFDDVLSTPSNEGVIRVTSTLTKTESASGPSTGSTTNDNFKNGDKIYVWADKTGTKDGYIKAWELTATDANGNFLGDSKAWPYDGLSLDFHALHGNFNFTESDLTKNWSDLTSLKHTVLPDQSYDDNRRKSDLLFAEKTGATHGSNVELSFSHLLAKITVKLDLENSQGIKAEELANSTVTLTNILPEAQISSTSLPENSVQSSSASGNRQPIIAGKPATVSNGEEIGSAIVPLQDFGGGKSDESSDNVITITLASSDGRSFSYKPTTNVTLSAGMEYTYTLKIINGELSVSSIIVNEFTTETTQEKKWDIYVEPSGS